MYELKNIAPKNTGVIEDFIVKIYSCATYHRTILT